MVRRRGLLRVSTEKEFVVACVYVACREMNIPRTLDEIAEIANADKVFAGKCYRLLLRNLKIRLQPIDSITYLSKIANKGGISKKTLHRAIEMMAEIKEHPFSSGKESNCIVHSSSICRLFRTGGKHKSISSCYCRRNECRDIKKTIFRCKNDFSSYDKQYNRTEKTKNLTTIFS